jgi:hypothetical protein
VACGSSPLSSWRRRVGPGDDGGAATWAIRGALVASGRWGAGQGGGVRDFSARQLV